MEVVLLWLDDLDDLIMAAALVLEKWRIPSLEIGFVAAVGLQGSVWWPALSLPELALASVACASVVVWLFGFLAWHVERETGARVSLPA
jgi:hypothetical protein